MNTYDPNNWLAQAVGQVRAEFDQKINNLAGAMRQHAARQAQTTDKKLEELATIARALDVSRSGGGITRIEDLPGRRVPFDMLVDIPIGNNTTSIREASVTISQEGPFIAVARVATFMSAFEFQVTQENATARFSGRSFGRYRPIHSAWDLNDAQPPGGLGGSIVPLFAALNGVPEVPGSMSGFRTMEFDGRVLVENAGSSYPRQNISVPSSLWTAEINSPQQLGALDFFERGEVITFRIQPTHVNNPPAGNVDGATIFGGTGITTSWPFLAGQFDRHEGIATPGLVDNNGDIVNVTTDPIQRLPDGILTIGYIGYRIQQPVGPIS